MVDMYPFLLNILQLFSALFIFVLGVGVVVILFMYIKDVTQTTHAIRRNYPVIGRFRYLFENLGEFFRQYFFAMDREELPFNRAERSWAYRAAKNLDNTVAFGSSRDLRPPGTVLFVNCPFPTLGRDAVPVGELTIGAGCPYPYRTSSLFNVSGMSYGALSAPAVMALAHGAKTAQAWMNTGEGGLSSHHLSGGCDIVFQIGTAKYGVRDAEGNLCDEKLREVAAHEQVKMFEVKLSQGAKPGKGGMLPAAKVNEEIAQIRGIAPGKDSISPNRHPEVNSVKELLEFLNHIREVTNKPVGFKYVLGAYGWLDSLFAEINQIGVEYAPRLYHYRLGRWRYRRSSDAIDRCNGFTITGKSAYDGG